MTALPVDHRPIMPRNVGLVEVAWQIGPAGLRRRALVVGQVIQLAQSVTATHRCEEMLLSIKIGKIGP
ncbi:hypothetical protein SMC26_08560 [Actinomadura fulvescens]|uniref:hypothetical protein n=1 Tax=Actinomadura fulvescens TaxID=46160 RepID=UPI0031D67371